MSRFKNILSWLFDSIYKYPLVMLWFGILCVLGIISNHYHNWLYTNEVWSSIISIIVILPLLVSTYIYWWYGKKSYTYIVQVALILLWVCNFIYIHSIPFDRIGTGIYNIYQFMFFAIWFLVLLYIYYQNESDDRKLRFVDSQIISSICITIFFVMVISLGIAGVFWSLDYLFDLNIDWSYFTDIVIFASSVIGGSIFLNNINNLHKVDQYYRNIVYIFAKYVLLGLLGIYTVIFLAYGVKILFTWDWPKGQLVYMTIWYFVLGILANVLLYPVSKDESWIKYIYNWFYAVSIVILFMWFMAIYLRIGDYGITINRYFVLLILSFCTLFCVYNFIIIDKKIVWLLIMLISFLWFSVLPYVWFSDWSYRSQVVRFDDLMLKSKNLWNDGRVINWIVWTGKIANQLYNQIEYLSDYDTIKYTQKYLSDSQFAELSSWLQNIKYKYDLSKEINKYILGGYEYDYMYTDGDIKVNCDFIYIYGKDNSNSEYNIEWYKKIVFVNFYANDAIMPSYLSWTNTWIIYRDQTRNINIDLTDLVKKNYNNGNCDQKNISEPIVWPNYKLYIRNLSADYNSGDIRINNITSDLLLK